MMNTDLLLPPFNVTHTSMGTMAMMDIEVIHPTAAIRRTRSGTRGDAYLLNLQYSSQAFINIISCAWQECDLSWAS